MIDGGCGQRAVTLKLGTAGLLNVCTDCAIGACACTVSMQECHYPSRSIGNGAACRLELDGNGRINA